MPSAQKTPLLPSLNRAAEAQALSAIEQLGRALPCSVTAVTGAIVTVKFEVVGPWTLPPVTMPLFGPEYIRYPIQVGDRGVTFPVDSYLGPTSGLGTGSSNPTVAQSNLSNLVFFPIGNKNWTAAPDANKVLIYGPHGVTIQDKTGKALVTVDNNGNCVVHGAKTFSWDCNGYGERYTFTGGSSFQHDTYFTGATVTTTAHAWTGSLPSP